MIKNFATYISKIILVAIFAILSFSQKELYGAKETGVERIRGCKANGEVEDFQEFISEDFKEMDYDLSNPFCLGQFAGTYAIIKGAIATINRSCLTGSPIPRLMPSLPKDLLEITKSGIKASKNPKSPCAGTYLGSIGTITATLGQVMHWHTAAKENYSSVSVCGSNWKGPNTDKYTMD